MIDLEVGLLVLAGVILYGAWFERNLQNHRDARLLLCVAAVVGVISVCIALIAAPSDLSV